MNDDSEMIRRARESLHESSQTLRPEIRQALQRARRQAVAQAMKATPLPWYLKWQYIGSTALACSLVIAVWVFRPDTPSSVPVAMDALQDLDIISGKESLEFYEDMEFYEWMEEEAHKDAV